MNTGIVSNSILIKKMFDHLLLVSVEKCPKSRPMPISIKGISCKVMDKQLKANKNNRVMETTRCCK